MLEFAVCTQVVAARVGGATERALEAAGKVDVVVVAYVGDDLAAQFAAVQVTAAGQTFERETHMPGFGTCNQLECGIYSSGQQRCSVLGVCKFIQYKILNVSLICF